jgi:hypothetical protein
LVEHIEQLLDVFPSIGIVEWTTSMVSRWSTIIVKIARGSGTWGLRGHIEHAKEFVQGHIISLAKAAACTTEKLGWTFLGAHFLDLTGR